MPEGVFLPHPGTVRRPWATEQQQELVAGLTWHDVKGRGVFVPWE